MSELIVPEAGELWQMNDGHHVWVRASQPSIDTDTSAPTVVFLDGLGCAGFVWRLLWPWLKPRHRLLHWNYRGHGKSPIPDDLGLINLDVILRDLFEVLERAEAERVVLVGHSMGVQLALEAAGRRAEHIAGLALLFGSYEHPIESWHGSEDPSNPSTPSNRAMRVLFDPLTSLIVGAEPLGPSTRTVLRSMWRGVLSLPLAYEVATRIEVDGRRLARADFGPYMHDLASIDPLVFCQLARELAAHSARQHLQHIRAPTLVVGGTRDTFTPGWRSEQMARAIPDAECLVIEGASHTGPLEHAELVYRRIARLLERAREPASAR